jgi:hypothetical protein
LGERPPEDKALEMQEREAILITRERTLERTIRDVLKREQVVTRKEERIGAFLRQLQGMGLGELAESIEQSFRSVIADLREGGPESTSDRPAATERMHDGGHFQVGADAAEAPPLASPVPSRPGSPLEGLEALEGLPPDARAQRYLDRLDRELEARPRGEVWDRADRMRYLSRTFQENGNHEKAAEFARRALKVLEHFA